MTKLKYNHQQLKQLCQQNDIAFLGLFGSHARGDAGPKSDVDLLVRFSKRIGLLQLVRIERKFAEFFNKEVDLVTEPALSPYIKDRVLSQLKPLYKYD